MIKIAHITDIHLTKDGSPIWETDVKRNFDLVVKKIMTSFSDIGAIVISGDLSNDGSIESYKYINDALNTIKIPTYVCPGNHDNISNMQYVFERGCVKMPKSLHVGDWKFIFLNTVISDEEDFGKNKARGRLSSSELQYLDEFISADEYNTVIVLHHPPLEPGGWLDRKLLDNRNEFNRIIYKYPQVKLVLYGHTHYNLQSKINDIIYSAPAAVSFAFDKNLSKFEVAKGEEGFSIVSLDGDSIEIKQIKIY